MKKRISYRIRDISPKTLLMRNESEFNEFIENKLKKEKDIDIKILKLDLRLVNSMSMYDDVDDDIDLVIDIYNYEIKGE